MFAAGGLTPPETQATKEAPASPGWGFSLPSREEAMAAFKASWERARL